MRGFLYLFLVALMTMPAKEGMAQSYVAHSVMSGGSGFEEPRLMEIVNGETYVLAHTESTNFPVTDGSSYKGNNDLLLIKYLADGQVAFAKYLGSLGNDNAYALKILNNDIYVLGTADSSGYPVLNGAAFHGRTDMVLTKLTTNGTMLFSTYIGGTGSEFPINKLLLSGNAIILGGYTNSIDYPGGYKGGSRDGFITNVNRNTGAVTASVCIGGNQEDSFNQVFADDAYVYAAGTSFSTNIPLTIGGLPGNNRNVLLAKFNVNDLSTQYLRLLGGTASQQLNGADLYNGELYVSGFTQSSNFPVTNGTAFSSTPNDVFDGYFTRISSNGSIGFSTYVNSDGWDFVSQLKVLNGITYIAVLSQNFIVPGQFNLVIFKYNANGSFNYRYSFRVDRSSPVYALLPVNEDLYVAGITQAPDFNTTTGGQYYTGGTGYVAHLDASGNAIFSQFIGKLTSIGSFETDQQSVYLMGQSDLNSIAVTDSSYLQGGSDYLLLKLNADGSTGYAGYFGGSANEVPGMLKLVNNDWYFCGRSRSADFPLTLNQSNQGLDDITLTNLSFCPTRYQLTDTLSPRVQSACRFGLAETISGPPLRVPGDSLPVLYINGLPRLQRSIEAQYQWQVSNSPAGPWTDIPAAIFRNYRPVLGGATQYYRRVAFTPAACGSSFIHYSDTAVVQLNGLTAPVVNAGGSITTCPGIPVTIGGAPTASGGNPPYVAYQWDQGAAAVSNPVVNPSSNTLYTVVVTDQAGCKSLSQALVQTFRANAGSDKPNCAGNPVRIGTAGIPAAANVSYSWSPTTHLSANNIAQPEANPLLTTTYTLSLTVPVGSGGFCVTTDSVVVTPVAAPVTPNFAGPDRTICLRSNTGLGTPPEPGFTYVWSPGSYLTSNTTAQTTYITGSILIPTPDPAILNVTAQKGGCSFTDQVVVTTIESRAGDLACGPRILGLPDRTPNINETYTWTRLSGTGSFLGATNQPQVPVTASVGGTSTYRLQVAYNGQTCVSQVDVPDSCIGCNTRIVAEAVYKCPGFDLNAGLVTLRAQTNLLNPLFTWSPTVGLSTYSGATVQLTDNVPRIYTVTATDANDTSIRCSGQIFVNNPAFSLPVFNAPDRSICANTPTAVGVAPVAGYSYQWTGTGLSNNFISNPLATIPFERSYPVRVADANGCEITDTVIVQVQNVLANAGPDWQVCSNAVITLGTPAQPNTQYVWEPQASAWQNSTNAFSAEPQVLVASNLTFRLTATTTAGCISTDSVRVTINDFPLVADASDTTICFNQPVLIGAPALPGVQYQWSPATGLSNPASAQPLANPTSSQQYTLVATFPGVCAATASDQVFVTVSDPRFNSPDITYCPDAGSFFLGAGVPVNAQSYNWQPAGLVTDASIANPATLNPPPNQVTAFSIAIVNADGCAYRDTVRITPVTTAPSAGPDRVICKGQTTLIGSVSNPTGNNISYAWSPVTNLSDANSANPIFTGTTGGNFVYVLTKFDGNINCRITDTVIIQVIDSLIPVLTSPVLCRNACTTIGTNPQPGVLYSWSPATGLSNPNIANPLVCVGSTGQLYTLTAQNGIGCSSTASLLVSVSSNQAPQVTIPDVTACVGQSSVFLQPAITPAGSYAYAWSPDNGTLSNVLIPNPEVLIGNPGIRTYQLQVTDNVNGCTNLATATVTVQNCSPLVTIGDYVWYDANRDGLQDAAEAGVNGVLVTLYNAADFVLGTTVTNASGLYLFNNIPPGNGYYVRFSRPAGYLFTLPLVGGAAATNNSKADTSGRSSAFDAIAGTSVLNIDAGLIPEGCVVPVSLLSFTGRLQGEQVLLQWQTTSEFNNDYFNVERKGDRSVFSSIGRVNGHGTTAVLQSYSLVDPAPVNGMNYYRLKQVDYDGRASYSAIVAIAVDQKQSILIYVDESNHTLQIQLPQIQDRMQIQLYNATGQLISSSLSQQRSNRYVVPLPALASGVYTVRMINENWEASQLIRIAR